MLANTAIYFGVSRFLATLRDPPETMLSFENARTNFYNSARHGLHAKLTWFDGSVNQARTLLLEEVLPMARQGLKLLNIDADDIDFYIGIIKARIHSGQTGSAWQRAYRQKYNADNLHLVAAYLERQRSGAPVHEWHV